MKTLFGKFTSIARLLCIVALVMVGFAHRPATAMPAAVEFAAYILPDGSLPTLCISETSGKPGMPADHGCDACRLAAAIAIPSPPDLDGRKITFSTAQYVVARQFSLIERLYPPSSGPRAPPLTEMSI